MADTRESVDGPGGQGLYLLGPLAFGASIVLQIMMAAFMRFGFARGRPFERQLTPYGRDISHPEYDLLIFVVGLALALLASLAVAAWWVRDTAQAPAAERAQRAKISALLLGGLGLASLVASLGLICSYWFSHDFYTARLPVEDPWNPLDCYRLLLPAAMASSCALWDLVLGRRRSTARAEHGERLALLRKVGVALFPIFLVLVIGTPPERWTRLAGAAFLGDRAHHLNFFVVGPALSFSHGRAFGTEIYSQYGIGWPWLLSALSPFVSIGMYGAFIGIAVVYACLYYVSWFFVLRIVLRSAVWAAVGVLLAVSWQLFTGINTGDVILQFPSSTMMRHPFDVVFFLALALHQRSGRLAWVALAGLAGALAVVFETETGLYLLVAFALFWLLESAKPARSGTPIAERTAPFAVLLVFYLTTATVALPLLLLASRGTMFSGEFFSGWLEPLIRYGSWGLGSIPISIVPDASLVLFVAMIGVHLGAIGYGTHRSFHGQARKDDVLLATISAYGLALLLLFAARSHPYNLWHASVPFAIALAILLHRADLALRRFLPHSGVAHVLCGGLIALLLCNANFLNYPSLLASPFRDPPDSGLSLMSEPLDLAGFPSDSGFVPGFRRIAAAIRKFAADGGEIAIFDGDDTVLYYATGVAPWSRYASLYKMAVSHRSVDKLKHEVTQRPPRSIVLRSYPDPPEFTFIWSAVHDLAKSRYVLADTVGDFEFWRRRDEAEGR